MKRNENVTMLVSIGVVVVGALLISVIDPVIGFEREEGLPYIAHQVLTMFVGAVMMGILARRR